MADAAIGAAIQVVLETVISLAADRIGLFFGFNKELESLKESATTIQAVLADAVERQGMDEQVKLWLKRLEGVAFEADNAFDELNYEILRCQVKSQNHQQQKQLKAGKVCPFFSFSYAKFAFHWRMASKIRDINTKLERIMQEAIKFGLNIRFQIQAALPVPATAGATSSRQTDSVVVPNVVGRAIDESNIVELLLSPSDKVVSIIPIVGMGGLGKTTLAKLVYNNPQINGHFDKRVWVCVAKKINIMELFKFILESLTRETVAVDHRDPIIQKIREELERKRYFLVLDDMWNDEQGLWNDFFTTLEGFNATNGSWCLATTRLEQVANTMSRHLKMNVDPYKLGNLTDNDCWSIIKKKVIAGEDVPQELEAIKKQILGRCGGLPLSASLIGGLLLNKRKEEWRFIMEESLLNGDQDDLNHILKVSFDNLSPTSVKNCFVYCSLFPQDTKLDKDLLIELWMAEGFLQSNPNDETLMHARGDKYLRILLQSSLLLEDVNKSRNTCCKMHDLVHDFAKSVLNQDRYLALNSFEGMAEDIIKENTTSDIIKKNTTSLRTLFLESSISGDVLSEFECLHVLKLSGEDVRVLPTTIGKLIHLRFLDISDSEITILPESLCKLYNLQTLRIKNGKLEEGLPKQMSNLISLRHLHYYDTDAEFQMPLEMGRLTRLQNLKFFNVGQEDGRGIEELGALKDLKGSLEIRYLELVNGKEGAEGAKLFEKPYLSKLTFVWGNWDQERDNYDENVLEGLQPHPNLQKLNIRNFMGDQFPGWFINLSTLVKLKFINCKRCRELPTLGQLPSLESLVLCGLENIRSIGLSFYGITSGSGGQVVVMSRKFFPALKYLFLEYMENLVEWKDEEEVRSTTGAAEVNLFPVLKTLTIDNCSRLTSAPSHFPSIEKLDISYNCHVSLLEKIVSSITTLSSLKLRVDTAIDSHNDEHISSLHLEKRHHSNNLEGDVECRLTLEGCGSVPSEMLERLCDRPSLRHLELKYASNLTRLACGTSLKSLTLWSCGNLRELPQDLDKFQALRNLSIEGCSRFNKLGGGGRGHKSFVFTSLEKLIISYCDELTSLPGEMSSASLQKVLVYNCHNLVSFPLDLRQTPSLESLYLSSCPKLMIADMPKGYGFLIGLRKLEIGPFSISETDEFDWSGLISSSSSTLTFLSFYGLPHVKSLPEQLQYLTSLTELCLRDFGIEALPDWIGNLASLETLKVSGCEKLLKLSSMAAMRCLTKLTFLQVLGSPLCKLQSGADSEWPKILPNLRLYIA